MKKHFMVDLETMGLRPNAAIVSIGATHFDQFNIVDRFYTAVNLKSCLDVGLTTDQSTVDWWAQQSPEARAAWDVEGAPELVDALVAFGAWLRQHSSEQSMCMWGNGSDFDLVLLVSAYRALEAETPWKFWNHHCFRTFKNLFGDGVTVRKGTHHHALDDAVYQTEAMLHMLKVKGIILP